MKIVCSSTMPFVEEAFSTLGETVVLEGREITADDVRDAELMAIRSTTKVNSKLLDGSPVRFIGTATIGTDHLDIPYMEDNNIHWCYSPGCNANSVAEYITSALLWIAQKGQFRLRGKTLGVVGVGNVGSRVVSRGRTLGMQVLQNDPPRQRCEPENESLFVSMDHLLEESDIVTMHVPLTRGGHDPTCQMAENEFMASMKPGAVFINAARGPILNSTALLAAMDNGTVEHAIIDTWEGEPEYRTDLLDAIDIGTPHIAGYSFEGKVAGTMMVYEEACRFLGVEPSWNPEASMPPPEVPVIDVDCRGKSFEEILWDIVRRVYDIRRDDADMRKKTCLEARRAEHFDSLRKGYHMRREFRYTSVTLKNAPEGLANTVAALGFQVAD
ncbi:MAG: 4-phosphoerythronate dehydrogenase [Kiritimatiellia bacterium]|nr:4-phosphoerythronate dehydrogenase [Kiritimatiellia bacterium]MDP6848600.1 4-phosphoerythronate dehydrogenase [Kiritimatiellia bacterium]